MDKYQGNDPNSTLKYFLKVKHTENKGQNKLASNRWYPMQVWDIALQLYHRPTAWYALPHWFMDNYQGTP